jgi:DNA-binding IclR family transcriptional regulator
MLARLPSVRSPSRSSIGDVIRPEQIGAAPFTRSTVTDPPTLRRELERVRRVGWPELVDELEDGHAALAVAVRSADGALFAAVGISGPTFRLGRARRRALLPRLQAAAAELAAP